MLRLRHIIPSSLLVLILSNLGLRAQSVDVPFDDGTTIRYTEKWNKPETDINGYFGINFGMVANPGIDNKMGFSPELLYEKRWSRFTLSSRVKMINFFDPRMDLGFRYRIGTSKSSLEQKVFLTSTSDFFERFTTMYFLRKETPISIGYELYAGTSFMYTGVSKKLTHPELVSHFGTTNTYYEITSKPSLITQSVDLGFAISWTSFMHYLAGSRSEYRFHQNRIQFVAHLPIYRRLKAEYTYVVTDPNTRRESKFNETDSDFKAFSDYYVPVGFGVNFESRKSNTKSTEFIAASTYQFGFSYYPLIEGGSYVFRMSTGFGFGRIGPRDKK